MHKTVAHKDWTAARLAFLEKEKAFTHARDELSAARRALPWEKVEKTYVFEDERGSVGLSDLFRGKSQLIVYHFMFGPDWEAGCKSCTFWADNLERSVVHLNHRDTNLVLVSRGPIEKLLAYRKRMGWTMEWVSSLNNSFNQDFAVSFAPDEAEEEDLQLRHHRARERGNAGHQRVREGRRRHLSHLFDLLARDRYGERHLSAPRSRAERPRRGRAWIFRWSGCAAATNI